MPRAKKVKLDMSGLTKFQNSLGNGITFRPGLFRKAEATKGFILEMGTKDGRQVARPWLSSILAPNSPTLNKIFGQVKQLVQDALRGENSKYKIAGNITVIVQDHLLDQVFDAPALKKSTIDNKKRKGASVPNYIGLDEFDMADAITTRVSGGRRHRL